MFSDTELVWSMKQSNTLKPKAAITFVSPEAAALQIINMEKKGLHFPEDRRFVEIVPDFQGLYATINQCSERLLPRWIPG